MTIADNVATVPRLLKWDKERIQKRVRELLELVKLDPDEFQGRYPSQLSGGQQRVGLARALAVEPEVMLLDEPFGAVDAITRTGLQEELLGLHRGLGKTFLLVTHDIHEAFKLGTRVMIMNEGKISQFDQPGNIIANPADDFTSSTDPVRKGAGENVGGIHMSKLTVYLARHYDDLLEALLEHLQITAVTLLFSLLIASALTVLAIYSKKTGEILVHIFSVLYSVPSLAMFAFLIPVTGLGKTTAVIVLVVYNQYLLLRNFISGLYGVEPAVVEAAEGLGMRRMQVLCQIRIPLAKRALFTGIQLAVVSTIGIATIAAMINAGGLGTILFDGLRTLNVYKIVIGSILSAGLAVGINALFKVAEKRM